jgi:xylulokinase
MYLGLDIGTSSVKALLLDDAEGVVAVGTAGLDVSRPHPLWSEQDPHHWIAGTEAAMAALKGRCDLSGVTGIGLSGHMHGATLLGADDTPLRPCILWNDGRSSVEAAELDANPTFRALTGNIVFPGFTAPKLLWVKRHEPEIFAKTAKVLLPKDYVRLWLTGEHAGEMSDAAGTSWLDVAKRDWSDDLLAATDLTRAHMPRLVEGTEASGTLRADLAKTWGIAATPVVAGGGGDNAASAAGVGVVAAGTAFVSLGTSGVLFVSNDRFRPNAESAVHAFCHAVPGIWHQMGVILSAAAALEWLSQITGKSAAELTAGLGEAFAGPSPVTFLPYLAGERTPHNDTTLRGAFAGLDLATGPEDLTRAVLEGVAFAFADCRDALAAAGTSLASALAVGGGSRSLYWLKVIATVLGIPIHVPVSGDFGAAFGAARLGRLAATGENPFAVLTQPDIARTVEPDPGLADAYAAAHSRWKALTPAIKEAMR